MEKGRTWVSILSLSVHGGWFCFADLRGGNGFIIEFESFVV